MVTKFTKGLSYYQLDPQLDSSLFIVSRLVCLLRCRPVELYCSTTTIQLEVTKKGSDLEGKINTGYILVGESGT